MQISRRNLLASAGLLPLSRVSAQTGTAPRVSVGLIGAGARGQELLKAALLIPAVQIVGLVDAYTGRLSRSLERTGAGPTVYHDYRELLASRSIDAVIIATPDHWHSQMVKDALQAGKDVYCEKPLTYKSSEGPAIVRLAESSGRILQVGSQGISSAIQLKARDLIQSGELGQITMIRAAFNRNTAGGAWLYPIPPDADSSTVNWPMFLGPAPHVPFDLERFFRWRCFWDYSGGIATDLFVHLCTTIHFLMNATVPARTIALGEQYRWKRNRDVPDTLNAVLEYTEGFTVNLGSTFNNETSPQATFQILGTKGSLSLAGDSVSFSPETAREDNRWVVDSWPRKLEEDYFRKLEETAGVENRKQRVVTGTTQFRQSGADGTFTHMLNFIDSVRTRKQPWENASQGHHAAACAHMINQSARSRKLVTWNSAADDVAVE